MGSGNKNDISERTYFRMDKGERLRSSNGIYIHHGNRIHNTKMGELAKSLGNILGWTGALFAFLANLPLNPISILIGIGSAVFIWYKALKMREDMLIRRVERKEKEHAFNEMVKSKTIKK